MISGYSNLFADTDKRHVDQTVINWLFSSEEVRAISQEFEHLIKGWIRFAEH